MISKRRQKSRAGFTFTLSMVLITLTLIGAASFAQEWRKSQQASTTKIVPSEALRLHGRIGSDVRAMMGAGAKLSTDNTTGSTTLTFSLTQPFKREGEPIAKVGDYSTSLPSNLRNLGYEAILSANNMSGTTATVIVTSNNGSLVGSNEGAYDITTFYHPIGISPSGIMANIFCNKRADSVGDLSVFGSSGAGAGYYYMVNYSEPGGKSYIRNFYAPGNSTATMKITYPDNSLLYFESIFSPTAEQNRTSIHYTKSSSGALILPFNTNSTGAVRDYSLFQEGVLLANGSSMPQWRSDCPRGGCYYFNGTGQYMQVPGGVALAGSQIPLPLGSEMIGNPWFEGVSPESADDGETDSWPFWATDGIGQYDAVEAITGANAQSFISVRIGTGRQGSAARIYTSPPISVSPSTAYTLSFWAKDTGSRGRYKVEAMVDGTKHCLSANGEWQQSCGFLQAQQSSTYAQNHVEFTTMPSPSSGTTPLQELTVSLYSGAETGAVFYDSVSLKQSTGMNGGFESYYYEGGSGAGPVQ